MTKEAKAPMVFTKPEYVIYLAKGYYHGVYVFLEFNKEDDIYTKDKDTEMGMIWTRGIWRMGNMRMKRSVPGGWFLRKMREGLMMRNHCYMLRDGIYKQERNSNQLRVGIVCKCQVITGDKRVCGTRFYI